MTKFLPPHVIDVRIRARETGGFRIWLPLVLLWPLLLVLLLLVLPFTVLADIILWVVGARYHHYTLLVLNSMRLLAEARGTRAHIDSDDALVIVDIN